VFGDTARRQAGKRYPLSRWKPWTFGTSSKVRGQSPAFLAAAPCL
jgi:hypothetical protein